MTAADTDINADIL